MRERGFIISRSLLGNGSVAAIMWANGSPHSQLRYDPWGKERYAQYATPSGYRYTSQRWDSGLGLYDYNGRYYDPALGKFISADTLVPDPAAPQAFNRYAYVRNNPLGFIDPTGHMDSPYDPGGGGGILPIDDGLDPLEEIIILVMRAMPTKEVCLGQLGCSGGDSYKDFLEYQLYPYQDTSNGILEYSEGILDASDFGLDTYEFFVSSSLIPGSWIPKVAAQLLDDRSANLYPEERIARGGIVGLEGLVVDQVSIIAGQKVAMETLKAGVSAGPVPALISVPGGLLLGFGTFTGIQIIGDYGSEYINKNIAFPMVRNFSEWGRSSSWDR